MKEIDKNINREYEAMKLYETIEFLPEEDRQKVNDLIASLLEKNDPEFLFVPPVQVAEIEKNREQRLVKVVE